MLINNIFALNHIILHTTSSHIHAFKYFHLRTFSTASYGLLNTSMSKAISRWPVEIYLVAVLFAFHKLLAKKFQKLHEINGRAIYFTPLTLILYNNA